MNTMLPSSAGRPAPAPTPETSPFWEAAAQGRLRLQICAACEELIFPPAGYCPACLSQALVWRELSGRGRLRAWTELFLPAFPGAPKPAVIAEVEPVEGRAAVLAMLTEAEPGTLHLGAPVSIRFARDANGWSYPYAVPDPEARP